MNKFERQGRQPADQQVLPEAIEGDLPEMAAEVIDLGDAPPLAPRAPRCVGPRVRGTAAPTLLALLALGAAAWRPSELA